MDQAEGTASPGWQPSALRQRSEVLALALHPAPSTATIAPTDVPDDD